MNRRILLKFGGNALSDKDDMNRFAQDVCTISNAGFTPVIVHGGGPEISAEMERRGMKALKVAGLRITDIDALHVAEEVLKSLNSEIVQVFQKAGCSVQGMSAEGIITASKKPPVLSDGKEVDLGVCRRCCVCKSSEHRFCSGVWQHPCNLPNLLRFKRIEIKCQCRHSRIRRCKSRRCFRNGSCYGCAGDSE